MASTSVGAQDRRPRLTLVVDDDEVNLLVLKMHMEQMGYATLSARSGREAIEAAATTGVDLIMMDLSMPEMDGIVAAREIQENMGMCAPAIVAVSGHVTQRHKDLCAAAGFADFLEKPVMLKDLQRVIRNVSQSFESPN